MVGQYLQPPEEKRWANRNLQITDGEYFDRVSHYEFTSAAGDAVDGEQQGWEEPNVAVYSSPNSKPSPAPVNVANLPDAGQAQTIDFVTEDADNEDAAWPQSAKPAADPQAATAGKDPYRADRVLVATVTKGLHAMPADRLLWTRVFVQPINFEFAGYTVASTDIKTVKVAGIENSNNSKLSFDFGLDALLPGLAKDPAASSAETSNKATADINQQYQNLGVDIQPRFLRIIRESATGGDVVGNTKIQLSMLTNPNMIQTTANDTHVQAPIDDPDRLALVVDQARLSDGVQYLNDDDASITVHPQDLLPHCPLIADVWMIYEIRQAKNGADHALEGLQTVELVRNGELRQKVEIVPADDIAPAVWSIKRRTNQPSLEQAPDLRANLPKGTSRRVVSTDYTNVSELTHWLKANPGKPLKHMAFDNREGETLVPFKHVSNDCGK